MPGEQLSHNKVRGAPANQFAVWGLCRSLNRFLPPRCGCVSLPGSANAFALQGVTAAREGSAKLQPRMDMFSAKSRNIAQHPVPFCPTNVCLDFIPVRCNANDVLKLNLRGKNARLAYRSNLRIQALGEDFGRAPRTPCQSQSAKSKQCRFKPEFQKRWEPNMNRK